MKSVKRTFLNLWVVLALVASVMPATQTAQANNTYQSLPFSQDWSNTGLITVNDDWSGVPGVIGYRGGADDAASIQKSLEINSEPAASGVK